MKTEDNTIGNPTQKDMFIVFSPFGFVHRLEEGESIEDFREDID